MNTRFGGALHTPGLKKCHVFLNSKKRQELVRRVKVTASDAWPQLAYTFRWPGREGLLIGVYQSSLRSCSIRFRNDRVMDLSPCDALGYVDCLPARITRTEIDSKKKGINNP